MKGENAAVFTGLIQNQRVTQHNQNIVEVVSLGTSVCSEAGLKAPLAEKREDTEKTEASP